MSIPEQAREFAEVIEIGLQQLYHNPRRVEIEAQSYNRNTIGKKPIGEYSNAMASDFSGLSPALIEAADLLRVHSSTAGIQYAGHRRNCRRIPGPPESDQRY